MHLTTFGIAVAIVTNKPFYNYIWRLIKLLLTIDLSARARIDDDAMA